MSPQEQMDCDGIVVCTDSELTRLECRPVAASRPYINHRGQAEQNGCHWSVTSQGEAGLREEIVQPREIRWFAVRSSFVLLIFEQFTSLVEMIFCSFFPLPPGFKFPFSRIIPKFFESPLLMPEPKQILFL